MIGKVILDRYKLIEKIGQGGSGSIYRGEHTTLKKKVAVKLLHAQLSTDDTALERFRREATTVASLENEHILQVLDYGRSDDNRLFFAMEFLEGETLTKVIERERQLTVERSVDILSQICEGLTEAHGLGYVHRDLRPRNVFLTNKRGRADFVKLLDFGLAKLIVPDAEAKQTAMGMTFGDPRYMSPEQARGEALDRRSDIYSLGALAFEMLTGSPPYQGSGTFEILQQHLDAPVPKVRDRRPDCPAWIDAAVQKALAKKPDGRFDTVAKLLEAIKTEPAKAAAPAPVAATAKPAAKPAVAPAPAPVVSMGPPAGEPVAAQASRPSSVKETQAMHTLAPRKAPEPVHTETRKGPAITSTSGSVEATPLSTKLPEAANVPSVVIEGGSNEKTVPAKVVPAAEAAPLPPPPSVEPTHKRKNDPTGEWFSNDSQPIKIKGNHADYDDLDENPARQSRTAHHRRRGGGPHPRRCRGDRAVAEGGAQAGARRGAGEAGGDGAVRAAGGAAVGRRREARRAGAGGAAVGRRREAGRGGPPACRRAVGGDRQARAAEAGSVGAAGRGRDEAGAARGQAVGGRVEARAVGARRRAGAGEGAGHARREGQAGRREADARRRRREAGRCAEREAQEAGRTRRGLQRIRSRPTRRRRPRRRPANRRRRSSSSSSAVRSSTRATWPAPPPTSTRRANTTRAAPRPSPASAKSRSSRATTRAPPCT